ncbi:zymogen granule membrane protein 16-like [Stigmatopora nigra]
MFLYLFLTSLCATCLAQPFQDHYSFSPTVGGGTGTQFVTEGVGRITAIRIWELNSAYITAIQLRYDYVWSNVVGRANNNQEPLEIYLHDGEKIIQVSGKFFVSNFIYQIIMVTNKGRLLVAGQPTQTTFNFYPVHQDAELRFLSGRSNGNGITSLGAHWAIFNGNETFV